MNLRELVDADLRRQLSEAELAARRLRHDGKANRERPPDEGETFTFYIHINNYWAQYGGKHGEYRSPSPETLEHAMVRAITQFENVNDRNDVQGDYTVVIMLPHGSSVSVPRQLWYPLHQRYGSYEGHRTLVTTAAALQLERSQP